MESTISCNIREASLRVLEHALSVKQNMTCQKTANWRRGNFKFSAKNFLPLCSVEDSESSRCVIFFSLCGTYQPKPSYFSLPFN